MDIKKPQLVKVGAFAYFFEGVLQHPPLFTSRCPYYYVVSNIFGYFCIIEGAV